VLGVREQQGLIIRLHRRCRNLHTTKLCGIQLSAVSVPHSSYWNMQREDHRGSTTPPQIGSGFFENTLEDKNRVASRDDRWM